MPLPRYGILVCQVLRHKREIRDPTPHFQLMVQANGRQYKVPVNVRSRVRPSEVVYACLPDFHHPMLGYLDGFPNGYTELGTGSRRGLDYLRGDYFDLDSVVAMPHHRKGPDNDIQDLLTHFAVMAEDRSQKAKLYVFGQPFVEGDRIEGLHDVHMNQGNHRSFQHDDAVWQDGGLILHLPKEKRYAAIFIAFQSQSLQTDNVTGHHLEKSPRFKDVIQGRWHVADTPKPGTIRMIAALVDPVGNDATGHQPEYLTLLNTRSGKIGLNGWKLQNGNGQEFPLDGLAIDGNDTLQVALRKHDFNLGNRGGKLSLLNRDGVVIHDAGYQEKQVIEGRTVIFEP